MALNLAIEWDYQQTGNNNNGGGFKSGATGTDRSLVTSPHLAFTDLETKNADYDRVYSATENANMTADQIGNVIQVISGTNDVPGWYEVIGNGDGGGDGLYLDIDRVCAIANTNDMVANLGGSLALPVDAFLELMTAGMTYHFKSGTYTLTAGMNVARDGTTTNFMKMIGYTSAHNDTCEGDDRPLIAAAANEFTFDNYWSARNFRLTTSHTDGWEFGVGGQATNVEITNSGSGETLYLTGAYGKAIGCSLFGGQMGIRGLTYLHVEGCYVFSATSYGIYSTTYPVLINNIVDGDGKDTNDGCYVSSGAFVVNNTFYDCIDGVHAASINGPTIMNNIFDTCTTCITSSAHNYIYVDYNNYHTYTQQRSSGVVGPHATTIDPDFGDEDAGDFSIGDTALKAGAMPGVFTGTSTTSYLDVGGVQREEAGGAPTTAVGVIGG